MSLSKQQFIRAKGRDNKAFWLNRGTITPRCHLKFGENGLMCAVETVAHDLHDIISFTHNC